MSWAGTKWPRLWCWNHWITQQVPKTAFPGPAKLPGRGPRRSFSSKCFFYALSCVVDAKTSANVLHIDLCFFRLVHMRYTVKGQTFCTLFDYQYLSVVNICQWDLEPSWIVDMSRICHGFLGHVNAPAFSLAFRAIHGRVDPRVASWGVSAQS